VPGGARYALPTTGSGSAGRRAGSAVAGWAVVAGGVGADRGV